MSKKLDKLLLSASSSLIKKNPCLNEQLLELAGNSANDLLTMLRKRNGFYALESALHIFPSHSNEKIIGLDKWNSTTLWRKEYGELVDNCLFFAEDVFGDQFCIKDNIIYTFNPETGILDYLADNIEDWAKAIVNDYDALTGYSLAHQWQEHYGQLPENKRLLPKIPFVAGGQFSLDNLYLGDSVEGMKYRAHIANQIKDLPDGAQIQFKIID